ncbi:hypothetical protein ANN_08003 [Periplaneta americana]|uniref:Transposase n=1 Tax=Periplaneta americana TaxID=6978 RepID=A0ABQ8T084_PERAM|nr:hypothetical protein ANN_08003 [Periplaneta americana]
MFFGGEVSWGEIKRDGVHIGPTLTSLGHQQGQCYVLLSQCSFQMKWKHESWCRYALSKWKGAISAREFEWGRMVGLREPDLSYRDILARTERAAMTMMHVWNQCIKEGRMQRRKGSGPRNVTTDWDDCHLVRMAVIDGSASSSVESTLEYCNRNHQCLTLQWARECRHWHAEWQNVVFSDESHFNLSYNDGCIHVRCYRGECNLRACIVEWHSRQTRSVMVWGAIGYNMQSHLLHIQGNLNSNCYIWEVLEPEVLPLLQATPHAIFQQDKARPHVARIVQAFFEERQQTCHTSAAIAAPRVESLSGPARRTAVWLGDKTSPGQTVGGERVGSRPQSHDAAGCGQSASWRAEAIMRVPTSENGNKLA